MQVRFMPNITNNKEVLVLGEIKPFKPLYFTVLSILFVSMFSYLTIHNALHTPESANKTTYIADYHIDSSYTK